MTMAPAWGLVDQPAPRAPTSPFPAGGPLLRPLRNLGLVARGEHARNMCLETVLDIGTATGQLPSCLDLHACPPNDWDRLDADMVVVSRGLTERVSARLRRAGDAILRSHVPMLFLPHSPRPCMIGGRVLIAWDGSLSAVAALTDTASLLCRAREVMLVDAQIPGGAQIAISEAADFIRSLPGSRLLDVAAQRMESPATLMLAARLTRADYLLMGGFGHWSALPALLYGDCDSPFLRTPVPLLLGH